MQTRSMSTVEAVTNTVIGFPINYFANFVVLPAFFPNIAMGFAVNFWLSLVYVLISVIRNYIVRRFFNWLQWKLGVTGLNHSQLIMLGFKKICKIK